jgi:hypothetical protein
MVCAPMLDPLTFGSCFQPFGCAPIGSTVQSLTNAQKLSLPSSTSVGTQVSVTDGFKVSGAGAGFYCDSGTTANSKPVYFLTGATPNDAITNSVSWDLDSLSWIIWDQYGSDPVASANQDVAFPWLATFDTATLTHPAIQTLMTPSTSQGGVFVSGGTQDGIYMVSIFLVMEVSTVT